MKAKIRVSKYPRICSECFMIDMDKAADDRQKCVGVTILLLSSCGANRNHIIHLCPEHAREWMHAFQTALENEWEGFK